MTTRTDEMAHMPGSDFGVLLPVSVNFDDMDPLGMLHNSRYRLLVARAWLALWRDRGFVSDSRLEGDAFNVLKAFTITFDIPVRKFGEYAVHLWLEHVGRTSSTAGYRVCSRESAQALMVPRGGA
jgi:acyl-CoA thioester hydrolase